MMRKLFRLLSSRLFWFALLMLMQFVLLVVGVFYISNNYYVLLFFLATSLFAALFVATRDESPDYKLAWMLIIVVFPLAGGVLYLIFGKKKIGRVAVRKILLTRDIARYKEDMELVDGQEGLARTESRQMSYIHSMTGFAPWRDSGVRYYAYGDDFMKDLIDDIRSARNFIFIEYFIIGRGLMWETILEELARKRAEGVSIRIIYDDLGSISAVPINYFRTLRSMGFEAYTFNPIALHMNPRLNYRDHRKIFNIDGNVCYTGGLNLADEYVNAKVRFGYWKDNAVRIEGPAVWNFTLMFLSVWRGLSRRDEDYESYRPTVKMPSDGYVQPFADSPFDDNAVARNVYIQAINNARRYVWIVTPYLILDSDMTTALSISAASGVDVRIVCPHYADKKSVHEVTRSVYRKLVASGVRIYEYWPGFIHSKTLVADDRMALVGTANLDYRSFFLHFELSVLFMGGSVVDEVKRDTQYALQRSVEQTEEELMKVSFVRRLVRTFFGFFAPAL